MSMTICDLKKIISNLPEDTILLVDARDINDVETVEIQYHSDGRVHLIFSDSE